MLYFTNENKKQTTAPPPPPRKKTNQPNKEKTCSLEYIKKFSKIIWGNYFCFLTIMLIDRPVITNYDSHVNLP